MTLDSRNTAHFSAQILFNGNFTVKEGRFIIIYILQSLILLFTNKFLSLEEACPVGWKTHGERCYKMITEEKTRMECVASCRSDLSLLASIGGEEEKEFIKENML